MLYMRTPPCIDDQPLSLFVIISLSIVKNELDPAITLPRVTIPPRRLGRGRPDMPASTYRSSRPTRTCQGRTRQWSTASCPTN